MGIQKKVYAIEESIDNKGPRGVRAKEYMKRYRTIHLSVGIKIMVQRKRPQTQLEIDHLVIKPER